ncbi:hypothetical protein CC2G_001017 [Coprinopsis cinerea AmutBmut pab1-1]|nr:hypothetical protein CC2G_001017 [Coprinopsis cinerea AmutBmut pab1-1]
MAPSTTSNSLNGSADPFKTVVRHPIYYIQSADLSFLIGNVQFKVHRYFFERESAFYRGKLTLPVSPGAIRQGSSDNEPIFFEDVTPEAFEKLCWVFYNPRYSLYDASVDDWSSILGLAHKWGFPQVKALAVRELEKKDFDDIDRIVVYHNNDVDRNLLIPRYAALCARETPLTLPEGMKLGMETTLAIASAREYVRAIKLADGSRSPISPTVEGEELASMIRDLFGIPPPAPAADADVTVKDASNASSSSVTKTEVDGERDPSANDNDGSAAVVTASATEAAAASKAKGATADTSSAGGGDIGGDNAANTDPLDVTNGAPAHGGDANSGDADAPAEKDTEKPSSEPVNGTDSRPSSPVTRRKGGKKNRYV